MTTSVDSRPLLSSLPVVIKPRYGLPFVRKSYAVKGFGPKQRWAVHNNDLPNVLRGLAERVYFVQDDARTDGVHFIPTPLPTLHYGQELREFCSELYPHLPMAAPVDQDQFLEYYKGRQRSVYERAAATLTSTPVTRKDAEVGTFVKAEKLNLTKKGDPAPRLIQPRNPRYNIEVGRHLRVIEKPVYKAIARVWGGPTVLKCNALDQGKALRDMWDGFREPVAVGLDAKRFDQHVSRAALVWEHSVYLRCFRKGDRALLGRLLSWQLRNKGVAYTPTGKVAYEVDGCRMSGDMNTSLGNCLIMCALVWTWCRKCGVRARLANNGDDCVVVMERCDLDKFQNGLSHWFLAMGFEMKVEPAVGRFELVEFCQTQPVWTPVGWMMVRNPHTALAKDLQSLLPLDVCLEAYFGAIGECGLAAYGNMPIYSAFYRVLKESGKKSRVMEHSTMCGGLKMLAHGLRHADATVDARTRESFCYAFGILPDEQTATERWLIEHPPPRALPQVTTPLAEQANFWIHG